MKVNSPITILPEGSIFWFDKMPNYSPINEGDLTLWQAGKGNFMEIKIDYYPPDQSVITGNVKDSHGSGTYSRWNVVVIKKANIIDKLVVQVKKWLK